MKGCMTTIGISILSIGGVAGAVAQTPTVTPQTGGTAPSVRDASKTGSPASAGTNTRPGASGESTMKNGGAPNAGNMQKQSEKMSKRKTKSKEMDRMKK